jgi:hypothetical protein
MIRPEQHLGRTTAERFVTLFYLGQRMEMLRRTSQSWTYMTSRSETSASRGGQLATSGLTSCKKPSKVPSSPTVLSPASSSINV